MKNKLKISKRLVILLIISLIIPVTILADTVAFKTVVTKNDMVVSGDFWLDVQMQITAGTSPRTLNSFTADIYYTSTISYNGSGECDWAFSVLNGYTDITATDLSGYVRLGCTGGNVGAMPGWDGWNVTTSWQTVVTLKFTIATATSVNISINDATNDAAYFNNIANNPAGFVTDWTVTNEDEGDITLPVVLTEFSSVYTINETGSEFVSVNWTTPSETDVLGFNIYRSKEANFNTSEMVNDEIIPGTNTTTTHNYTYNDEEIFNEEIQAGDIYWYWLETVELGGNSYVYEEPSQLIIPDDYEPIIPPDLPIIYGLYQNWSNPFNPSSSNTKIFFNLHNSSQVKINVYNIKGQLVKCIYNGYAEFDDNNPRPQVAYWNGCDVNGTQQKSGIYFYRMIVNGNEEEIKILLLIR